MAKLKDFDEVKKYAELITLMPPYFLADKFRKSFEEMAVHTRKRKPEDLLLKRRPNEAADVLDYRICNYESITYGSMNKAFDNLNRILTGMNYKLHITDEAVKDYLLTKNFKRTTFDGFFTKIYLKRMIEDPNGFLVWLPGGEGMENTSVPVEPYPVLLFSFNLIDWEDDYIVFLADEKNLIKTIERRKTVVKEGKVYYIITKTGFYKYKEIKNGLYELTEEYTHNLGELPVIPLGGDYNADGFYNSFFEPYIAFGNESIRQFSDAQALSVMAAHPIREEFYMECEVQEVKAKKGTNAKTLDGDDERTYTTKTEVKPISRSPFDVIQRPIPDVDSEGLGGRVLDAAIPTVRFINQDIAYVKNAWESTFDLLDRGEDALHLNLGQSNQSGVAKEIDLLSHEDMLSKIGNQLLDAKQTSARFIDAYINNKSYADAEVKLTKPATFRIKDESELMEELGKLKAGNAPAMLVSAVARELASLRFSGDEINQKIFEIIATYDPLFIYSISEKQGMVISGLTNKDDATKSAYYYTILLNISKEIGEAAFLESTNEALNEKFLSLVDSYLLTQTKIVDSNGNEDPNP